jgi:hypothetical protein
LQEAHRSGCPINLTLEVLGDRWSLIVSRDNRPVASPAQLADMGYKVAFDALLHLLVARHFTKCGLEELNATGISAARRADCTLDHHVAPLP